MDTYDVVVIGSGPGGYPAAIRAAQLGATVALVERDALGGTCLNCGCIPTKSLIAGASRYYRMTHAEEFGLKTEHASLDYATLCDRKLRVVAGMRKGMEALLKGHGVTVFRGTGMFVGADIIGVTGQESKNDTGPVDAALRTRATIIATGSAPLIQSSLPASDRIIDSTKFLDMTTLPSSLMVLGGGVIGCEFACMAAQLGVKVTIVELLDNIVATLDVDIRRELHRSMVKELGITIHTGSPLLDISDTGDCVAGMAGGTRVQAEFMVVATGRRPVTEGLALENVNINPTDTGHLVVDEFGRTSEASIYAVGDVCAGSPQLAHAATSQGLVAAENACSLQNRPNETLIPACIYTYPEIGTVGLTEQETRDKQVRTGKFMFAGLGRALISGETQGFVKLLVDARTDRLLGAHAVGPHSTELIAEATTAIHAGLTADQFGRTIHCHPTFSEAWMEAAHALHDRSVHQPPKRAPDIKSRKTA